MTLTDFYALFPRWEEELCSWERARETLEKAVSEQAHRPEEILYFRSHWDLLTLLQGILRLRPFLTLICPPGRGMSSPQEDRIAALMRAYGHDGVTGPMVADFFHAWRESQAPGDCPPLTPDTCFTLTPQGQAALAAAGKEPPSHDVG